MATHPSAGPGPLCWPQAPLLATGPSAGPRPLCWPLVPLLALGPSAGHWPLCWPQACLLATGPSTGHRPLCWPGAPLLATGPSAGHGPLCWPQSPLKQCASQLMRTWPRAVHLLSSGPLLPVPRARAGPLAFPSACMSRGPEEDQGKHKALQACPDLPAPRPHQASGGDTAARMPFARRPHPRIDQKA